MASGCIVGGLINLTVLLWSSTSALVTERCGLSCHEGLLCCGGTRSHQLRSGECSLCSPCDGPLFQHNINPSACFGGTSSNVPTVTPVVCVCSAGVLLGAVPEHWDTEQGLPWHCALGESQAGTFNSS